MLCLHVGPPVPVSYRAGTHERTGVRLHGQFCVVPAHSSPRWLLSKPARSLLLRLRPTLLRETADTMGLGAGGDELLPSIHLRDAQIERIGWMMQTEEHDGHPGGRLFADGLATALAARLLALQAPRSAPPGHPAHAWPGSKLRRVVEYIDANLDQDLSLAELAAVAGFSVSHFKPLFRRAVGVPAHRFVIERRVERARVALLESERSVTDIAFEAGFAHPSHLSRWMRRVLGITPSKLRNAVG